MIKCDKKNDDSEELCDMDCLKYSVECVVCECLNCVKSRCGAKNLPVGLLVTEFETQE